MAMYFLHPRTAACNQEPSGKRAVLHQLGFCQKVQGKGKEKEGKLKSHEIETG